MGLDIVSGDQRQDERVARVPAGVRIYAIGDIHGCIDQLRALRRKIEEDAARAGEGRARSRRRVLVYLGDYIDRGPDSRGVIDLLLREPLPGFESVHLLGNHEQFMLRFLEGVAEPMQDPMFWAMMNGGDATWRSYGIDPLAAREAPDTVDWLRRELSALVPGEHKAFLSGLKLSHEEGDYLFVHAGVRPGVPLEEQSPEDLIWIREPFLNSPADHGKIVVHGHSASHEPELMANRIGIDTGACYGGPLTALVLEGAEQRLLQAR